MGLDPRRWIERPVRQASEARLIRLGNRALRVLAKQRVFLGAEPGQCFGVGRAPAQVGEQVRYAPAPVEKFEVGRARHERRQSRECGKLEAIPQVVIDGSGRVLVVDDDALIRDTLATALGDEGYAVRVAHNGRAALVTIESWRPDVIVLDLMMPVMDGQTFRAAQRSVADTAQIPVIVLSATHEVHGRAANLGAAAIFAKPFDLGALLEVIARLLADQSRAELPS